MLRSFSKKPNNVLNDQIIEDEQANNIPHKKKKKKDIEDSRPGYGPYGGFGGSHLPTGGPYFTPYDTTARLEESNLKFADLDHDSNKRLQALWFALGSLLSVLSEEYSVPKVLNQDYWSGNFDIKQLIEALKNMGTSDANLALEVADEIHHLQIAFLKGFTKEAAPRWTLDEIELLKNTYISQREKNVPHNEIYEALADVMDRSYKSIKQKLEALYQTDPDLKAFKYDSWSREKIVDIIKEAYINGEPLNRMHLQKKLRFQIANHSEPKCVTRGFQCWFESFDHAIAEAILEVGFEREGGQLTDTPITSMDEALWYYRKSEKRAHRWTESEIIHLFQLAHKAGLPLTHQFFAAHPDIYKPLLRVNRSLEGIDDSIELLGKTWGEMATKAVPEYQNWYDEAGNAKRSTGEIRVQRFLDLNNIPYRIPTGGDKIAVQDPKLKELGYKNFVPDFFILDKDGREVAVVEVFGSVADSQASNGQVADEYTEKIQAKMETFQKMPYDFIAIHDNSKYGSDLSDNKLFEKFQRYMPINMAA